MKTKLALMAAITAFTYGFTQEKQQMNPRIELYSKKVDSIVISEKSKMNAELDVIDKSFSQNKITSDEKQKQRTEIASKYQQIINDKIEAEKSGLEEATKEMVRDAVLEGKNPIPPSRYSLQLGSNGFKMEMFPARRKNPKELLNSLAMTFSFIGTNMTSKDQPFRFYSKDSEVKNTVYNSYNFALRYESQVGGFKSPLFYRFGLGLRSDQFSAKYGKVYSQEGHTLSVQEFTKGNLKQTRFNNSYIFVPVDLRFVLNPKYVEFEGNTYLDNKKDQLSIVLGVYGGVRVGTVIYNKYSNEFSSRIVEREKVGYGMNDLVVGGKFGIGYGGFNLFIQKDFTPTFNNNAQLTKKYGLQIGIELASIYF